MGIAPEAREREIAAERVLARRLQAGDRRAFDELYRAYEGRLFTFCKRICGDETEAADLVQETFLRVLRRLPQLDVDTINLGAYLYATARNLSYGSVKRAGRVELDERIEERGGPDDALERQPEGAALLDAQQREVRDAAAALAPRQRMALALCDLEGRSYREIGLILDINENAVAQLVSRARIRLREELRLSQIDRSKLPEQCRAMLGPLSAYLDGQLRGARRDEVVAHLGECAICQAVVAAMGDASKRYRALLPALPLVGLYEGTARAAESEGLLQSAAPLPPPPPEPPADDDWDWDRDAGGGSGGRRRRRAAAGVVGGAALILLCAAGVVVAARTDSDTTVADPPTSSTAPQGAGSDIAQAAGLTTSGAARGGLATQLTTSSTSSSTATTSSGTSTTASTTSTASSAPPASTGATTAPERTTRTGTTTTAPPPATTATGTTTTDTAVPPPVTTTATTTSEPPPASLPDLVVSFVRPFTGGTVVTVTNVGNAPAGPSAAVVSFGGKPIGGGVIAALDPGQSGTVTVKCPGGSAAPITGTYGATADARGSVAELDEGNNGGSADGTC